MVAMLLCLVVGGLAGAGGCLLLRGLRRGTSVHIGWCAVPVAVLWAVLGWRLAVGALPWWWLPVPAALVWFGVLLAATDLRHCRLPDALTLPAYPVLAAAIALAATRAGWPLATGAVLGALVLYCVHAGIHLARPAALGAGDVKLSGSLGAALGAVGWPAIVVATTMAAVLTLALRAVTPVRIRARWQHGTPHGPGLLTAAFLITTFPGHPIPP